MDADHTYAETYPARRLTQDMLTLGGAKEWIA
jgi:hypothetical protein